MTRTNMDDEDWANVENGLLAPWQLARQQARFERIMTAAREEVALETSSEELPALVPAEN